MAIDVPFSHWLLLLTLLLALFLALSKRRAELVALADGATGHRRDPGRVQPVPARSDDRRRHGVDAAGLRLLHDQPGDGGRSSAPTGCVWTMPFPLYGIFRYLYLVHQQEGGGNPSDMLLTDRPLLACVGALGRRGHR